ncbi:OmpA/MotB domain protein [Leadbetterella byssophila DSM 17132]|uniref:OmpA/MotB domain protein n=1 Tax=Leadbetterella byssophila (strain DSM 17132 / JCM 16389 / KACC 11308 / NBRC 106382 / 4M15) TaxID=649349 RepID=E4RSL1_LEAB4|nr:OmpA family protein [Leadbetterella byssophila]ADQ18581.1 OmpA/MotB domain protein [Leadbetterella byssophila DSM 17132]
MRLCWVLLFLAFNVWGQSAQKWIQKGDEYRQKLAFADAVDAYQKALKREQSLSEGEKVQLKIGLGEAYYQLRRYELAFQSWEPVKEKAPVSLHKKYAQVLAALGRYEEAAKIWGKVQGGQLQERVLLNPDPLVRNADSYQIEYLGINSNNPEFSPTYYKDGLVFVSARKSARMVKRIFSWDKTDFLDLFFVSERALKKKDMAVLGTGGDNLMQAGARPLGKDYYTPQTSNDTPTIGHAIGELEEYKEFSSIPSTPFSKRLNSKYHEGPSIFYDTKMIFTRTGKSGKLQLYSASKKGKDWQVHGALSFVSELYSFGHPAISKDAKVLFFISDMPGGFGGTDIYYSVINNGKFSRPVNAGSKVNTSGDELFPFMDEGGNLYFSSNGHAGLGGLDLFVLDWDFQKMEARDLVRNLGAPLNSSFDDFGIIANRDRTEGYFSSNRKRGGNDDDIYRFARLGQVYGFRDLVVQIKDRSGLLKDVLVQCGYYMQNTGVEGQVSLCLQADSDFDITIKKEGYLTKVVPYTNKGKSEYIPDTLHILMDKVPLPGKITQHWDAGKFIDFAVWVTDDQNRPLSDVKVILRSGSEVQIQISDQDGKVIFKRDPERNYELESEKSGYSKIVENIRSEVRKERKTPQKIHRSTMYKIGDVIRLENIYYDNESYKLGAQAKQSLRKIGELLQKSPELAIEVSSHTDTRGSAQANMILSERRAEEVKKFLVQYISGHRISAVGKGESQPVNACGDGVQCTDAEHARNRRTEIRILKLVSSE